MMGIKNTDIAVIGMSCRFPKSKNINEFWSNLKNGVDCISSFSEEELISSGIDKKVLQLPNYVKRGGFVDGTDLFDAQFFDIPPLEAKNMDPQHRFFLECTWEALESSAYNPHTYEGSIGVFASCGINKYLLQHILNNKNTHLDAYTLMILNDKDALATKVAYKLNLQGPAVTIQTACSSSLVAIHYASRSLLNGECNIALAGGVSISSLTKEGYMYKKGMILSEDGFCRAFDKNATGTALGNGTGIVVLKRAEYAIEDRDFIYAIIKGSAVNNDGKNKVGYTAPSVEGQMKVILEAWENAEIDGQELNYIEAHGTGTKLGDPIEVEALKLAMQEYTNDKQFCAIGSVKTNIGHTDTAAGCAGFIKAALSLHYKKIPPSLHYTQPNSRINFSQSPFFVNTQLFDISQKNQTHKMGVSSFGIGGTNAHVVLEENIYSTINKKEEPWNLLLLSAKTPCSLEKMTENLAHYLNENNVNLSDVAYTLQIGREVFNYRKVIVCKGKADAKKEIKKQGSFRIYDTNQKAKNRPIVFLFSGKVHHLAKATKELYESQDIFRKNIDLCDKILGDKLDLISILYSQRNKDSDFADLLAFVTEYSFAKLWFSWGLSPESTIAYGIGELTAACFSGVFSLENALWLLCDRPIENINLNPPQRPFLSNRISQWMTAEQAMDLSYWISLKQKSSISKNGQILSQISDSAILSMGDEEESNNILCSCREKIDIFSSLSMNEGKSQRQFLLDTLGKLWLHGVYIDWNIFYEGKKRYRLPLPTYCFERKRYWVEQSKSKLETLTAEQEIKVEPDICDWFYAPSWKKLPLIKKEQKDTFLIFTNENPLSLQLIEKLKKQGKQICEVKIGECFQKQDQTYFVNPDCLNDYYDLVKNLQKERMLPERVIHLWNLSQDNYLTLDLIDTAYNLGLYSLVYFAKALGKFHVTQNIDIATISNGLHSVTEEEILFPEKSTLLGAVKVIPLEYQNIRCCNIDIELPKSTSTINALTDIIFNEIMSDFSKTVIALRGKNRWTPCYEPIRLQKTSTSLLLKDQGVYLILGGLGGIGLVIAEHLAQKTEKAKLILVGRSQFPDKNNWSNYIEKNGKEDPTSIKILKLLELEECGAEVLVFSADITNLLHMQLVIEHTKKKFNQINGVIHSAGSVDYGGIIQKRAQKETEALLAPKVRGLLILDELLSLNQLDFTVVFSSLGNILHKTQFGQIGYNAANEFLDAFALYKKTKNHNVLSINWDTWQDVGMATTVKKRYLSKNNTNIKSYEGAEVFAISLDSLLPRIIISTVDLYTKKRFLESTIKNFTKRKTNLEVRPESSASYLSSQNDTKNVIIKIWEKYLGITGIGIEDNFFDLGGDSLLAIQILDEINSALATNLDIHVLLESPTISKICKLFEQKPFSKLDSSLLVTLQKGEISKVPLFLIHPIGGHVYFYRELAEELDKNQPVYGINAIGLNQKEKPLRDVKKMAQLYTKEMHKIQKQGPYYLGGSSFGGTVAFEIAQQLLSIGQEVKLLMMIDTPGPGKMPKDLSSDLDIIDYLFKVGLNISLPKNILNDRTMLLDFIKQNASEDMIHGRINDQMLEHLVKLFQAHSYAMRNYAPLIYPGKIIFFSPKEENEYHSSNLEESWFDFAQKRIQVYKVPGNHITMNKKPNVTFIAKKLQSYLV